MASQKTAKAAGNQELAGIAAINNTHYTAEQTHVVRMKTAPTGA